jgi:LysR family nitrogen assimilation transcriptional regulator
MTTADLSPEPKGIDVGQLRDFILVVDSGSLTRAAMLAGVSQPAMSQRMAQLETEVGKRLLERGPRGVEPTSTGLELYRGAQQVVRQLDRLAESLDSASGDIRGSVSVGVPSTVAPLLLPTLVPLLRRRHPGIHLQLFESMSDYIEERLGRGRLDLAVLYRDDANDRPGEIPLYEEDLYLATASSIDPSEEPISVRELAERQFVAPGARSNLRTLVERAFAVHRMVPDVIADVESLAAMIRIAQRGDASVVLPRSTVATHARSGLTLRPLVDPQVRRNVAVGVASEYQEPRIAVVAVRDGIVDAVHELAADGAWPGITPIHR